MAEIKSVFDFVKIINGKQNRNFTDEEFSKFNVFMINRIYAGDPGFVFIANALNTGNITPQMAFDFYYEMIPRNNRFIKYKFKKSGKSDEEIILISEYFNCNLRIAEMYSDNIDEQEMKKIKELLDKGGVKNGKRE